MIKIRVEFFMIKILITTSLIFWIEVWFLDRNFAYGK